MHYIYLLDIYQESQLQRGVGGAWCFALFDIGQTGDDGFIWHRDAAALWEHHRYCLGFTAGEDAFFVFDLWFSYIPDRDFLPMALHAQEKRDGRLQN